MGFFENGEGKKKPSAATSALAAATIIALVAWGIKRMFGTTTTAAGVLAVAAVVGTDIAFTVIGKKMGDRRDEEAWTPCREEKKEPSAAAGVLAAATIVALLAWGIERVFGAATATAVVLAAAAIAGAAIAKKRRERRDRETRINTAVTAAAVVGTATAAAVVGTALVGLMMTNPSRRR